MTHDTRSWEERFIELVDRPGMRVTARLRRSHPYSGELRMITFNSHSHQITLRIQPDKPHQPGVINPHARYQVITIDTRNAVYFMDFKRGGEIVTRNNHTITFH